MRTRLQRLLALSVFALAAQAGIQASAHAQVSFNIQVGPPVPIYEQAPVMVPGDVWAPGYWAWHGDRHVWIRGRTIVQRVGYRWEPDVWEQRDNRYYRHVGRWERDTAYRAPPRAQGPRFAGDRDDDGPGKHGKHGKKGKKYKGDKHDGR